MTSVLVEMKVFNFYVWYDSSQLSIPELNIHNDRAYSMGATFINYGSKWGYVGGTDYNAVQELHKMAALNRGTLTATIDYSVYAEEWPTIEPLIDAAYLEAQSLLNIPLTENFDTTSAMLSSAWF
ncbi:hypothetical protein H4S07_001235 [Coemansia furcata]|uniref:Uncharacterized protein n=1 Tax=Coemansia furcata TaxID=417177 RepID=A0ACC1LQ30_9FUNG|nr:hypothetical protein H4S07_001235 [Coemansia furcata]